MRFYIALFFLFIATIRFSKAQDLNQLSQQIMEAETSELEEVLNFQVLQLEEADSAVQLDLIHLLLNTQTKKQSVLQAASIDFAVGWFHLKLFENYARAVYYFDLCHEKAFQTDDRALMGKSSLMAMQVFVDLGMFDEALGYLYKIEQLFQKYNFTGFESITASLFSIGDFFYRAGNHQQAVQYFEKALIFNDLQQGGKEVMRAYNTLGLSYLRLSEYQRAIEAFQVSNQLAKERGDTAWEALTYGNLGMVFSAQGLFDDAIAHLTYDLETSELQLGWVSACHAAVLLADIYVKQRDYKSAELYLSKARALEDKSPSVYLKSLISGTEAELFGRMGKYEGAFEAQRRLVALKEELSTTSEQQAAEQTKKRHLFELQKRELLLELERKSAQHQLDKLQRLLFAIIVLLFLIVTVAWLLISRDRKTRHQHQLNHRRQLVQLGMNNLKREFELLKRIEDTEQIKVHINPLLEQLKEFMQIHENNFYSRLKASFPNLHPEDVHVLALLKLKFTPEDILSMKVVQSNEWSAYCSDLSKKLGGMNSEALQTFLKQL